jgi:hypothetical protein
MAEIDSCLEEVIDVIGHAMPGAYPKRTSYDLVATLGAEIDAMGDE